MCSSDLTTSSCPKPKTISPYWFGPRTAPLSIPREFRVKPAKAVREVGAFLLDYPQWRVAKKDGTRDLRCRDNTVVREFSVLEIGRWRLVSRSVVRLYDFVIALRGMGHKIAFSNEEAEKVNRINGQARLR